MIKPWKFLTLCCLVFLTACAGGIINTSVNGPFDLHAPIAIIPFENNTETPLAGERAMAITLAVLQSRGLCDIKAYSSKSVQNSVFPGTDNVNSQHALLQWARGTHARYAMTGSVNEWAYKVGLDGEAVVGLSLQLIDLHSARVVWSAVGSQSGVPRLAVSTIAQQLINDLLKGLFKSSIRTVNYKASR